jgi:hypothetical protein
MHGGLQPAESKLLWYTTHLERSAGGIPVEGSFAFAALDSAGDVITEGVYWPAIPAKVIYRAQALSERVGSTNGHAAFLAGVRRAQSDLGDAVGEVRIVHTSAGHHGKFEAHALYSIVVRRVPSVERRKSCGLMTRGLACAWPTSCRAGSTQ